MTACIKLPVDASRLDVMCSLAALEPGESLHLPDPEIPHMSPGSGWIARREPTGFTINPDGAAPLVMGSIAEALDWLAPVA